jgi:hypothetical protein
VVVTMSTRLFSQVCKELRHRTQHRYPLSFPVTTLANEIRESTDVERDTLLLEKYHTLLVSIREQSVWSDLMP